MAYADVEIRNHHNVVTIPLPSLQSKTKFDTVENIEMRKPEFGDSGSYIKNDSVVESAMMERDNPIIAEPPNSYKDYGDSLENLGYFIIPRSVADDPRYQGARLKYQKVLFTILKHAAFSPTTHAIGTEIIPIAIGQFCVTERNLVELCNKGVKFKDDLVDRNIVTRAVQFFCKCQYLNQQVIHGKTLLTITISEFYKTEKTPSEPDSEPKVSQNRANKEEDKENKEDNISSEKTPFTPTEFATSLLDDFFFSLSSSLPEHPKASMKKTKTEYEAAESLGKIYQYNTPLIKEVMRYAHQKGGFWLGVVHTMKSFKKQFSKMHAQMKNPVKSSFQKPESSHNKKFNKDERPAPTGMRLDFSNQETKK